MTRFFYNLFIYFFKAVMSLLSLVSRKAKARIIGIKATRHKLPAALKSLAPNKVMIHVASLGEYEQALPVIRWILKNTQYDIVLTFFSVSGFEPSDDSEPRLIKTYLPADTRHEMEKFIELVQPKIVLILKNEWWWNLMYTLKQNQISTYLIAARIRNNHYFIRFPFPFFKKGFECFKSLFVLDKASKSEVSKIYSGEIIISGDTRLDQVLFTANTSSELTLPEIDEHVIIYGSVWPEDIIIIRNTAAYFPDSVHIIFPHELNIQSLDFFQEEFNESILVSDLGEIRTAGIYIVSKVGILKNAYGLANFAYIGGGFGAGIHNILEASVFGLPVFFGPKHLKSLEATILKDLNCAFSISSSAELKSIFDIFNNLEERKLIESKLKAYFSPRKCPTAIICEQIFLTNQP